VTQSKRPDRYAAIGGVRRGEILLISGEQFSFLEQKGRRKFNDELRYKIKSTLENFIVRREMDERASTPEQQHRLLKRFQNNIKDLKDILDVSDIRNTFHDPKNTPADWHGAFRTTHRIEDASKFSPRADNENRSWEERKPFILDRPRHLSIPAAQELLDQHRTDPLIDLEKFHVELTWLNIICNRALNDFEAECKAAPKGRNKDDALDSLLLSLERIYNKSPGKVRGFKSFCHAALSLLPENIRPDLEKIQTESLGRRKNRARTSA